MNSNFWAIKFPRSLIVFTWGLSIIENSFYDYFDLSLMASMFIFILWPFCGDGNDY